MKVHKSFCRNCVATCGLELDVENDRIVKVRPDKHHPVSDGYICVKSNMSVDLGNGVEDRLLGSLKRNADDSFSPLDAEAAMGEIGSRLKAIVDTYGPRSVGIYFGTGAYSNALAVPLCKSFMHGIGSPNWFSTMTIDQSASWVTMLRMGRMGSGKHPISDLQSVLFVGTNPLVSHQGVIAPEIKAMRERGCKIVVIDPRATRTARQADLHLPLLPGEDARLLAAMIHVILANNWFDQDFCQSFADQLPALRAAVAGFTPEAAAGPCGLTPELIVDAARMFSAHRPGRVFTGTGVGMSRQSNLAHHLAETLDVLCGNYRRAGDRVSNRSALFPYQPFAGVIPAKRSWEQEPRMRSHDIGQLLGEFPTSALPDEILHDGEDRLRALIVWAGNPLLALGQSAKVRAAFDRLDLLVTLDTRFTATAARSHYAIGCATQYERHDLSQLRDITGFNSATFLQYAAPAVPAPSDVVQETDFWWSMGRHLGLQMEFRRAGYGIDFSVASGSRPLDMKQPPAQEQLAAWWCADSLVDFAELTSHPGGLLVGSDTTVAEMADGGSRLQLCPDDVAAEIARISVPRQDADHYPFRLAVRRHLESLNSAFTQADRARRRHPANFIYMNPEDMAAASLVDRDRISIVSRHGQTSGHVVADGDVRAGVISVSHLWGSAEGSTNEHGLVDAFTGALVSLDDELETENRMPLLSSIPVRLERLFP